MSAPDLVPPAPVRLVRHGEVAAAHRATFYGGAEVPLSEEGAAASVALARVLAAEPTALVVSSPLSRALAVAEPLAAAAGCELVIDEAFRELDRGDWTHLHKDELERRQPGAIAGYLADPEAGAAPGGERESQLTARVWSGCDRLVTRASGRPTVVVCHGHVIRVIMRRLLGWDGPRSLQHFVPYHAVVRVELAVDGTGTLLSEPDSVLPEALR